MEEPKLEDDEDTKGRIKIYTIDEENNQLQVLDIPYELKTQKDGTTKREYTKLEDCYFIFTYNYKQKGHEYQHTQKVIKRYKYSDITKIDKLFTTETSKNKNTLLPVKAENLFKETDKILDSIKFGERILSSNLKKIPSSIRNLYNIMLYIAKNLSINLLELQKYDKDNLEAYNIIIKILNNIEPNEFDKENLKRR